MSEWSEYDTEERHRRQRLLLLRQLSPPFCRYLDLDLAPVPAPAVLLHTSTCPSHSRALSPRNTPIVKTGSSPGCVVYVAYTGPGCENVNVS